MKQMEPNSNKSRMAEQVYHRFEADILNKVLKPGDRLPAERDLQNKLGVSRWTVREAYRILRQKGLVEIKRGGGTFVTKVDNDLAGTIINTLILQRGVSSEHLQEFREAIEGRCAVFAVERATDDQISEFKRLLEQLKRKLEQLGDDYEFYLLEWRRGPALGQHMLIQNITFKLTFKNDILQTKDFDLNPVFFTINFNHFRFGQHHLTHFNRFIKSN